MTIRIALIGTAMLVLSASTAASQGRPPQKVVLSEAVMKSMGANKPKSKTPLTARLGIVPRSNVVATKRGNAAPTSVREIKATSKKR